MNAKRERGQIMVLVALGLVALLGFTALAMDMGMAYADRRQAQNAADAGALAGARYAGNWLRGNNGICSGFGDVQKQEIREAALSGLGNYYPAASTTVSVSNCTASEIVVKVDLAHTVRGAVFQRDTTNVVQAVTRVKSGAMAEGFGLVSLGLVCGNSNGNGKGGVEIPYEMTYSGNVDVKVSTGGIFSNSCIDVNGASGTVHADNGIFYYTGVDDSHGVLQPPAQKVNYRIPVYDIPELPRNCSNLQNRGSYSGKKNENHTLEPGIYSSISAEGGKVILNPGLYCISGKVSGKYGLQLTGNASIEGHGVTIYLEGTAGGIDFGGGGVIDLRSPNTSAIPPVPVVNSSVDKLLIYEDPANTSDLVLTGNSGFTFAGTIYAPKGTVDIGGNNKSDGGTLNSQIIADAVTVHGGPEITITYKAEDNYTGDVLADVLH